MSTQLEKFSGFKAELAIAETFEEIKLIESKSDAAAEFAKKEGFGKEIQDNWGEFCVEIKRKKGAWLKENFPQGGTNQYNKKEGSKPQPSKMPVTKEESSQARLIDNEPELVKEAIEEIKEDKKKVVTPATVTTIVQKKVKKEKEKDPKYQKEQEEKNRHKFFADTARDLNKILNHVERIIQGDRIPETISDFDLLDSIKHNMYRSIRLSGEAGIDVPIYWDKMNCKVKHLKHLKPPKKDKSKKDELEDAVIVN